MGSFANPNGAANADLHSFILGKMKGLRRSSVVSINSIVKDIRTAMPSCSLSNERLIKLITETAMLLGLVPVLDRSPGAAVYVCGSAGFAAAAGDLLMDLGVPADLVRVERFGPTG